MAFLAQRLEGRNGGQNPLLGQCDDRLGSLAELRQEFERPAVKLDQVLYDGQAQSGAASAFSWAREP